MPIPVIFDTDIDDLYALALILANEKWEWNEKGDIQLL